MLLRRNLFYNRIKNNTKDSEDFYLHIVNKKNNFDYFSYLNQFFENENNDMKYFKEAKDLKNFQFESKKESFYFSFPGCIFCEHTFNTFKALFIHINLCHMDYEINFSVRKKINFYLIKISNYKLYIRIL